MFYPWPKVTGDAEKKDGQWIKVTALQRRKKKLRENSGKGSGCI